MTQKEFTDKLYAAGWDAPCDAQHDHIKVLFKEWFPKELEIENLKNSVEELEYEITHLELVREELAERMNE